ncbi:MAG: hypothetical protein PVG33_07100 [Chloroflexota bacterium]
MAEIGQQAKGGEDQQGKACAGSFRRRPFCTLVVSHPLPLAAVALGRTIRASGPIR